MVLILTSLSTFFPIDFFLLSFSSFSQLHSWLSVLKCSFVLCPLPLHQPNSGLNSGPYEAHMYVLVTPRLPWALRLCTSLVTDLWHCWVPVPLSCTPVIHLTVTFTHPGTHLGHLLMPNSHSCILSIVISQPWDLAILWGSSGRKKKHQKNPPKKKKILHEKKWEDLVSVGDHSVSSDYDYHPSTRLLYDSEGRLLVWLVLNWLLWFVLTNGFAISSIGKPRLANENWTAKVNLPREDKIEFYIVTHFIIIMMNCDCFPGEKWQYL